MLFQKLSLIAALAAAIAAQEISQDDIPQQCRSICAQVVTIARDCDNRHDNDAAELQCICQAQNANTLLPTCEACVAQYDTDDDDDDNDNNDNDVREVLTRCNFSTTTFNSASASSIASSLASSAASQSAAVTTVTSGTVVMTTTNPTASAAQNTNAAPAPTAAAAVGLGALGLALGML